MCLKMKLTQSYAFCLFISFFVVVVTEKRICPMKLGNSVMLQPLDPLAESLYLKFSVAN